MISVLIKTRSSYPVEREKIRKAVADFLIQNGVNGNVQVSVGIVGRRKMRSLNQKYLGQNEATDVLAFPLENSRERQTVFVNPPEDLLRLGDVVICYPEAISTAIAENILVDEVLVKLIKHGTAHLLGIHH